MSMDIKDFEKQFEGMGFSEPQRTYILAKTWYEFLNESEKEIDQKIVDENEFFYPEDECGHKKGERITEGFDTCLLVKTKDWDRYEELLETERRRMGFNFEKGESMTGEALRLYSQAANELVDWGYKKLKEYTNDCPDMDTNLIKRNIVKRDQFCEIAMKIKGLD